MRFLSVASILLLAPVLHAQPSAAVPDDKKPKPDPPCTVRSLNTGSFFNLSPISIKSDTKEKREESWLAKGYDYSVNFTINFCAPVVEHLEDVVGLEPEQWGNVSAFYEDRGKIYSIGYAHLCPVGCWCATEKDQQNSRFETNVVFHSVPHVFMLPSPPPKHPSNPKLHTNITGEC